MTPEQKQQAKQLIADWTNVSKTSTPAVWFLNGDCMAGFLQELVDAPVAEPVAYIEHHKGGDNLVWDNPGGEYSALYTAPPAPSVPDEVPDAVIDAVADAIGGAYDCLRVWSAWEYGTMGPDDFLPVTDDADRVAEIARAALSSWLATAPTPADVLIATNPAQISSLAAPAPEPVARVTGYYAGHLSIATVDGRVLPTGTALYTAPPAPSVPDMPLSMEQFGGLVGLARDDASEKAIVYKATNIYGETCYFGVKSTAQAWAKSGSVDEVRLRDLRVVATPTPAEAPADVARDAALYCAVQRACAELPEGWEIRIELERSAGTVSLVNPDGEDVDYPSDHEYMASDINDAIDSAIAAEKGGAK